MKHGWLDSVCFDQRKKEKTLDRKIKGQKNPYSDCACPSCPAHASVIFLSLYFSVQFPFRLRYVRAGQSVVFFDFGRGPGWV